MLKTNGGACIDVDAIGLTMAGRYRLDSLLGRGGMGSVFGAIDLKLDRPVAIKVILQQYLSDDAVVARFVREAKVIAQLASNPHIMTIYDLDFAEDQSPFIVAERLRGRSLKVFMRESPRPSRTWVLEVGIQVALALFDVHARGFTHRDIKPANVFVVETAAIPLLAKVIDFGLSKGPQFALGSSGAKSGPIAGTVGYLAPEVIDGNEPSSASDIYAFGITLYELATGQFPYAASSPAEMLAAHREQPPIDLPSERVAFPESFRELLMQMLSKDPRARPSTESCLRRLRGANRELDQIRGRG